MHRRINACHQCGLEIFCPFSYNVFFVFKTECEIANSNNFVWLLTRQDNDHRLQHTPKTADYIHTKTAVWHGTWPDSPLHRAADIIRIDRECDKKHCLFTFSFIACMHRLDRDNLNSVNSFFFFVNFLLDIWVHLPTFLLFILTKRNVSVFNSAFIFGRLFISCQSNCVISPKNNEFPKNSKHSCFCSFIFTKLK